MNAPAAFGTYRVFHQTGNGVQGPVFRAFDSRQDRLVAIKAFAVDSAPAPIVRLADALRQLVTQLAVPVPGLVPVIEAGIEGTRPFLVMECQTGEGLDLLLRRSAPLSIEDAAPILTGIAEAIDQAHAAGLAHGALHPRDVFVTGGRYVTVNGFGVAQAFARADVSAAVRRPYAAPEPGGAWDIRTDIYALGVMAHEMLTGVRPSGTGEQDGAFARSTTPADRVQLRRLLAVALAERPADRFQTGAAFVAALSAIARHERVPGPALPEPDNAESRPAPESVAVVVPVHAVADHDLIRPAGRAVSPAPAPHAGARARARRAPSVGALAAVGVVAVALGSGLAYRLAVRPRSAAVVSPAMPTMAPATAADIVLKREVPTPTVEAAVPDEGPASEVRPPVVADARVGVARANQLNITSEPSGALVTIDGRLSGATPTTVRSLSPGTYLVRVARPGHVPREERVTLASASVRTLAFALEPGLVPTTTSLGWVDVDSRPRGADVVIDGRAFGRTPLRVPSLTSGTHDLALKLGGYVSATRRLEIAAGRSTSLSVTLQSLER